MKNVSAVGLAFFLTSCVPIDQLPPGTVPDQPGRNKSAVAFPDIDAPAATLNTTHFVIRGYSESVIRPVSATAENIFGRVANETGLYSYLSSVTYNLVVYKDKDEFALKTKMNPDVRATTAGMTIYTYPGPGLEPAFAYEVTGLAFRQYLDQKAEPLRWIEEGLALDQQIEQSSEGDRSAFIARQSRDLRDKRIAFQQMTFALPASKDNRTTELWYLQVESVIHYLLAQGSALSFAGFLNSLRAGADVDQALASNYPGKFRSLADLESAWKYTL